MELHAVISVAAANEPDVYLAFVDLTDMNGERYETEYVSRPDDTFGLAPSVRAGIDQWIADGKPVLPYAPPAVDLIAYTAQKRWEKEVGGIEVGGMPVFTDDRSKTLIMGARQAADADPAFTTQWKTAAGAFITLDAATIMAISNAVLTHVAACFAREATVIAAIEDETITNTAEIDGAFDAVEWPIPSGGS